MPKNNHEFPILSFFSGGGLMDMGFIKAGFDIIWTNEVDLRFADFYKQGITSWKNGIGLGEDGIEYSISNTKSIKLIPPAQIIAEAFGKEGKRPFGIIGGPPCQDFSVNGNLNGFKGARGSLTDAYLYKILELQPAFFVMENVTGLIKIKKNAEHFFDLLRIMKDDFLIDWDVLNSLEYGVPQSRERIFVVGILKKMFDLGNINHNEDGKWFPFHRNTKFKNPQELYNWPESVSFGSKVEEPEGIPLSLCVESCLVKEGTENNIPNANEYFNLKGDKRRLRGIKEGETSRRSFKRLHRYRYSPTACYGNNEVHLHPYQHRRLSVRETLRIQGVEDCYVLTTKGLLSKKFKMIGNGVPTPLALALATNLKGFINDLTILD